MSQAVKGKRRYVGSLHGIIEGMSITLPPIMVSRIGKDILMLRNMSHSLCYQGIRFSE
jgi:hypothetical protein